MGQISKKPTKESLKEMNELSLSGSSKKAQEMQKHKEKAEQRSQADQVNPKI